MFSLAGLKQEVIRQHVLESFALTILAPSLVNFQSVVFRDHYVKPLKTTTTTHRAPKRSLDLSSAFM